MLNKHLEYKDGVVTLNEEYMRYLAKKSGLRSKKRRHIKKRVYKVLMRILMDKIV